MNRDKYLSKAKEIKSGKWVVGFYLEDKCGYAKIIDNHTGEIMGIDIFTLCRCTSLTDRNNELIFENDSVLVGVKVGGIEYRGFVYQFKTGEWKISWDDDACERCLISHVKCCRVIGNKFDEDK